MSEVEYDLMKRCCSKSKALLLGLFCGKIYGALDCFSNFGELYCLEGDGLPFISIGVDFSGNLVSIGAGSFSGNGLLLCSIGIGFSGNDGLLVSIGVGSLRFSSPWIGGLVFGNGLFFGNCLSGDNLLFSERVGDVDLEGNGADGVGFAIRSTVIVSIGFVGIGTSPPVLFRKKN